MRTKSIYNRLARLTVTAFVATTFVACDDDDIDNYYSRSNSVISMTSSADYVVLDESNPDAVALTIEWDKAHPYGNEYITTYQYQIEALGSKASAIKEFEDDGHYSRQYTNKDLQDMLVGHFGCLTSTISTLNLTVTASFEGPRVVIPDIATISVKVKTYGAKQYLADQLFIGGEATGDKMIELQPTSATSGIYTWNGPLTKGKVNFPVIYGDENNAISPADRDTEITDGDMPAVMVDAKEAHSWIIPEADNYRVTVNMNNHTVKFVSAASVIEADRVYLEGSSIGDRIVEIERTLEADDVFAWRGELTAGKLYMPIEYLGNITMAFVPKAANDHDIHDGEAHEFKQVSAETGIAASFWTIPADGTYRIVVNTSERSVVIYSAATDFEDIEVTYNNTVAGNNKFTQKVTELWMWGGFNKGAHDDGLKTGFQSKFKLIQSLANPYIFVYRGAAIPRETSTDDWSKKSAQGALNFLVSNIENNVYAYGANIAAERNKYRSYLSVQLGDELDLVAGQSHNRYAYFCVPENCTFVMVDIKNLKVKFDNK